MNQPPPATRCPKCGYFNGGAFTICPVCKTPIAPHVGDLCVGITSMLIACVAHVMGLL